MYINIHIRIYVIFVIYLKPANNMYILHTYIIYVYNKYVYVSVYIHIYIYIYIEREREKHTYLINMHGCACVLFYPARLFGAYSTCLVGFAP